jgi:hypothetical protein
LVVLAHAWVLHLVARAPDPMVTRVPAIELRRIALPVLAPPTHTVATGPMRAPPTAPKTALVAASKQKPAAPSEPTHGAVAPAALAAPSIDAAVASPLDAAVAPAPTRVPPSTDLVFALQRGAQSGEARLSWRADGQRYALSLQATLPSGRELEQHSQGGFDAAGLAPLRLADRRRGRDLRAANFQREHGKITFSGPRWELPLEAGTQDRLSWLVQLVALIGGATDALRDGSELAMWVVGARGAASHWRFEVRGQQRVAVDGQALDAWWLVREPAHPYDLRVEVWLGAEHGHWPLKLRQTQIPGGEPLEWSLRARTPIEPGT